MNSKETGMMAIRILALVMWMQVVAAFGFIIENGAIKIALFVLLSVYSCVFVLAARPLANRFAQSEENSSDIKCMSRAGWMVLIIAIVGMDIVISSCIQISLRTHPFLSQLTGSQYSDPWVTRMLGFDVMTPIVRLLAGLSLIIGAKKLVWIWYKKVNIKIEDCEQTS
jgi:hypothetical protein